MADATKVGSIYYDASIDPKGVDEGANQIGSILDRLKGHFNSLNPTVRALGLSLGAYLTASTAIDFFKSAIEEANQANRILAQTEAVVKSTGGAAGYSATQIAQMAEQIEKNTALSHDAAQEGMNMLLTFTNIGHDVFPQATQAMLDMSTALNGGVIPTGEDLKNTAIQLGKALQDPVIGVTALRRVGVAFNDTQQETIKGLVETNRLAEAQALILHELSSEFGGSLNAQSQTFEGKMASLGNTLKAFKETVGNSIIPAITYLVSAFSDSSGALQGLLVPIRAVATAFVVLGLTIKEVGILLSTIIAAAFEAATGNWKQAQGVLSEGFKAMLNEGSNAQESMNKIWSGGQNDNTEALKSALSKQDQARSEAQKKLAKDLAEEDDKYNDEVKKKTKTFTQSLDDMIWAHQDKVKSFKKDLDKENADFSKSLADKVSAFNQTMADLKTSHQDKVASINKDISRLSTQSMDDLEVQIEKETAKGKNTSQTRLTILKQQLAGEKLAYDQKLSDLKENLAIENRDYDNSVAEKTAANKKELDDLTTTHNQKVTETKDELAKEEAILKAHQSDVDGIKGKAREDDITRLKGQYADENAEALKQHLKKIADIKEQSGIEATALMDTYKSTLAAGAPSLASSSKDIGKLAGEGLGEGGKEAARNSGQTILETFVNYIKDRASHLNWMDMFGIASGGASGLFSAFLPHFASGINNFGGGMALVGENGPELVNLPSGADVIPSGMSADIMKKLGSSQGTNQTIYINIDKIAGMQDVQSLGRELGFRASLLPG